VASLLGYQELIVAASGFRPGSMLMVAVKRSSSANYYLLTMAFYLLGR
jgi:hypothetical protein